VQPSLWRDVVAHVDWMIRGPKLSGCNCHYSCPCEFNAPPTDPELCEGLEAMEIEEGWFGDTRLDGLRFGAIYRWPGPVHLGGGVVQGVIDAKASELQRGALGTILAGKEQEPTTPFAIYGATIAKEIDTVFSEIEFECDVAAGRGRFVVPGLFECSIEPIRNPVTGRIFRGALHLHDGFEFKGAEIASATFSGSGELKMRHADRYGFLTHVAYGPNGLIGEKSYPQPGGWLR
jgi:hypothetical protein